MRFDSIVVGGGLSGLTAGIALAEAGQRVAVVSTGQSALHFSSGSLELLGYNADAQPVTNPLKEIAALDGTHPYSRIGIDAVTKLLGTVAAMLDRAGVAVSGGSDTNHWRLTPVGLLKPAWMTLADYVTFQRPEEFLGKRIAVVEIAGFLDFFAGFLAAGLEKAGALVTTHTVSTTLLDNLRTSSTAMRATNIARVLIGEAVGDLARAINSAVDTDTPDLVLLPAVVGFDSDHEARRLQELVRFPLRYASTLGPSVPGVRMQMLLAKRLRRLGGSYMPGDTVTRAYYDGDTLTGVNTVNFDNERLEARQYIFAGGSFFSHGLRALPNEIVEPALGLDVDAPADRAQWYANDIFARQPYMRYGIALADNDMHALRNGRPLTNVHVVGAALPGADSLTESSGGGIAILSALHVANHILAQS